MSEFAALLDTPKKASLQTQSAHLRASLKDFERTFACNNNGRKPSKDEIKGDADIAAKYKEYNRVRDVLVGKISYKAFIQPAKSPTRKKQHIRVDSGLSWSPEQKNSHATPRKTLRSVSTGSDEAPSSSTPKPVYLSAIGPTPQRDGRVFGLFDMMSNSAKSSQATPSTSRKRKIDGLFGESMEQNQQEKIAYTPSQKRTKNVGDLLEHLTDSHTLTPETGNRRRGRSPVSEGRKFMLSQFFATPSTMRYSNSEVNQKEPNKTPLRDDVLGHSASKDNFQQLDATPAYLRRTTSFKDRLLLASSPSLGDDTGSGRSPVARRGPPTLQHFRSVTRSSSQIITESRQTANNDDSDDDDDLDALRELEQNEVNTLVRDSQMPFYNSDDEQLDLSDSKKTEDQPMRAWKKKGQKRTTKRAKIRPAMAKLPAVPKFVVAEDADESEDEQDVSQILETQFQDHMNGESITKYNDDSASDFDENGLHDSDTEINQAVGKKSTQSDRVRGDLKQKSDLTDITKKKDKKKAGMINPNAQSHMNFRSLKIRNKNSKAKGAGRGRFGRR